MSFWRAMFLGQALYWSLAVTVGFENWTQRTEGMIASVFLSLAAFDWDVR